MFIFFSNAVNKLHLDTSKRVSKYFYWANVLSSTVSTHLRSRTLPAACDPNCTFEPWNQAFVRAHGVPCPPHVPPLLAVRLSLSACSSWRSSDSSADAASLSLTASVSIRIAPPCWTKEGTDTNLLVYKFDLLLFCKIENKTMWF